MKTEKSTIIAFSEHSCNQWWQGLAEETKTLLTGTTDSKKNLVFWNKLHPSDREALYQYWQVRTGQQDMQEDDLQSLMLEVVCELADIDLENEFGIPREDMCDAEGSFYEKYQDRFNDLYDEIEDRLLNNDFVTE